jgi:very-short-patch-repair endonuclease
MWCEATALTLRWGGVLDRYSAAFLWGIDLLPKNAKVSVTVPAEVRLMPHPRRRVFRTVLAADDVTSLAGLPVTTPIRTAFDLGRQVNRQEAIVALDALCHRRLVRFTDLAAYADRHAGRPGAGRLRGRLTQVDALAESPMETRLRLLLGDAGLPPAASQYRVVDRAGRFVGRVDLAYPEWRVAIEYEGDHHREQRQFRRDVARLNALREAGWLVVRFTADDVLRHPDDVVRQVSHVLRQAQDAPLR